MSSTFDIRTMLAGLFLPLGLVALLVASGCTVQSYRLLHEGVRRPGIVTSIKRSSSTKGTSYYPIVHFETPDGQSHEIRPNFSSNPPAYKVGEAVTVIYPPNNPTDASIDSFLGLWMGTLIAGIMGTIFTLIGGFGLAGYIKQGRTRAWLQQHGSRISTKVVAIEENPRISVNRHHPFQIVSEGTTPFKTGPLTFRSQNIWRNPTTVAPLGSSIDVLIDPNDVSRYWMDISTILSAFSLSE